jgi:hypothetical protein
LGTMPDVRFWILHSAIMAGGLVLLIFVRILFGHLLAPSFEAPKEAPA